MLGNYLQLSFESNNSFSSAQGLAASDSRTVSQIYLGEYYHEECCCFRFIAFVLVVVILGLFFS